MRGFPFAGRHSNPRRQALLVYSVYVGLAHLSRDAPGVLGDRRALNRHLMEALVG